MEITRQRGSWLNILANDQKKYINGIPNDPWGIPYRYRYPGKFRNFDIWTLGADNSEGGLDENSDIGNWATKNKSKYFSGFSLLELIVVISIISVVGILLEYHQIF